MKRREFITLLGGAAAGWPLVARAQQPNRIVRIGYLDPVGDIEARDFMMEDRNANGHLERLTTLASELALLPVDILVAAGGEASIRAALQATDKIPIVMTISADPISSGVVTSLARPDGNITGMSALASEMAGKRVELLKDTLPRASRVAVLWNPDNKSKIAEWNDTQTAAKAAGLTLMPIEARIPEELEAAFASILHERPDAMITLTESLTLVSRERIGNFAVLNHLPMFAELREFAVAGGLASYGANRPDMWRRAAGYVHKIMRGAKPSDLPIEQPVKFELVINLKTAKALDITVPPTLLGRADEVIE